MRELSSNAIGRTNSRTSSGHMASLPFLASSLCLLSVVSHVFWVPGAFPDHCFNFSPPNWTHLLRNQHASQPGPASLTRHIFLTRRTSQSEVPLEPRCSSRSDAPSHWTGHSALSWSPVLKHKSFYQPHCSGAPNLAATIICMGKTLIRFRVHHGFSLGKKFS